MLVEEIRRFVDLTTHGVDSTGARVALLAAHDRRVESQLEKLHANQRYLRDKLEFYRSRLDASR